MAARGADLNCSERTTRQVGWQTRANRSSSFLRQGAGGFFPRDWARLRFTGDGVSGEFIALKLQFAPIILKACQPERSKRYASAGEMRAALLEAQKALEREG